jgi:ACS family hexuronate transporter-like MFS transporter
MRYLLGLWEAVNFPICLMIIGRIFPARERSLASGIFASGAFLATLIAPKVVIFFSNEYTWRYSFILAGALGVVWLIPWLIIFKRPEERAVEWNRSSGYGIKLSRMLDILKNPSFWGVALIGIGIIPSLYFATQWLPYFLERSVGLTYDQRLGNTLMYIYLMQDVGLWVGGAIVLWLSRKYLSILNARRIVIGVGFVLMASVLLLNFVASAVATIVILCFFTFGIGAFLGNQHAFKQDIDKQQVATVSAWVGFIEMMFTHFVIKEIGVLTDNTGDFTQVFVLLAGLALVAFVTVFVLLKPRWLDIT